jgi:NADH-quinone oxidoreductase subunit L
MPFTAAAFLIGWLSIAGVPPLSGFWSKGDVLQNAWAVTPALYVVGAAAAFLTAYYMGREYLLAFGGARRWLAEHGAELHPHDAEAVMSVPLALLALASIFGGIINLPWWPFLMHWLAPVFGANLLNPNESAPERWVFGVADAVIATVGVIASVALWRDAVDRPPLEPRFLFMAWWVDAAYDRLVARPSTSLATVLAEGDRTVIDGAVVGVATALRDSGTRLRRLQGGYVRSYALGIVLGVVVLVAYVVVWARA